MDEDPLVLGIFGVITHLYAVQTLYNTDPITASYEGTAISIDFKNQLYAVFFVMGLVHFSLMTASNLLG